MSQLTLNPFLNEWYQIGTYIDNMFTWQIHVDYLYAKPQQKW